MSPRRVQLRRTKGHRKPPGAVVVARPTKWGNPFTGIPAADAVDMYRSYLRARDHLRTDAIRELHGKDLLDGRPHKDFPAETAA